MTTRVFGALCVCAALAACGDDPPDTRPGVRILKPVAGEMVDPGKSVPVTFEVFGIDPMSPAGPDGTKPRFHLMLDQIGPGVGYVVARVDGGNDVARSAREGEPINVPDPMYAAPAQIITTGMHTIQLLLRYNSDQYVPNQHPPGEVTITVR